MSIKKLVLKIIVLFVLLFVALFLKITPTSSYSFAAAPVCYEAPSTVRQPVDWSFFADDTQSSVDPPQAPLTLVGSRGTSGWSSKPIAFEPRKLYRLSFKASCSDVHDEQGCLTCGPDFAHFDFQKIEQRDEPTKPYSFVFFTPDGDESQYSIQLSQWETLRTFRFAEPRLSVVQPVFQLLTASPKSTSSDIFLLPLGTGESIDADGKYTFRAFSHGEENTDYDRPLFATNSHFNNLWRFNNDTTVVYRFELTPHVLHKLQTNRSIVHGRLDRLPNLPIESGAISIGSNDWRSGVLLIEGSVDGKTWRKLGEMNGCRSQPISIESVLSGVPCSELFIRLRGNSGANEEETDFTIRSFSVSLNAKIDPEISFEGAGATFFAEYDADNSEDAQGLDGVLWGVDSSKKYYVVKNAFAYQASLNEPLFTQLDGSSIPDENEPNQTIQKVFKANLKRPVSFEKKVFPYFRQNYSRKIEKISDASKDVEVSWCEPDYNVPRIPEEVLFQPAEPIKMSAAKNDFESFQLILRPTNDELRDLSINLEGALTNETGDVISSSLVQIRYAYYHNIVVPTDSNSVVGWRPDALVPVTQGYDGKGGSLYVKTGQNLPIWVTVQIPENASSGIYSGTIRLTANSDQFDVRVPFQLEVWDFTLPRKFSCASAYGLTTDQIFTYHRCDSEDEQRAVWENYLQLCSDYHICPCEPIPFDPYEVQWRLEDDPPCCDIDFSKFDLELERVLSKYSFTNFALGVSGLGGGTAKDHSEGEIEGYTDESYEYQSMFKDFGGKLQRHLQEKGLIDFAYIELYDEPQLDDYEFLAKECLKVQNCMPLIPKMVTVEPNETLLQTFAKYHTGIDIWTPNAALYSRDQSQAERKRGAKFWQYAALGPYCGIYIDHPAFESRVWRWNLFNEKFVGALHWSVDYWTSDAAYPSPDRPQNPYLDPMSYADNYWVEGAIHPWGNGEGRFLYPPLALAFNPDDVNFKFERPNASIRLEMLREGAQDYEMLVMLEKLLQSKETTKEERQKYDVLLDLSEITTDVSHFTTNPQKVYQRRREIARAIVELQKR